MLLRDSANKTKQISVKLIKTLKCGLNNLLFANKTKLSTEESFDSFSST